MVEAKPEQQRGSPGRPAGNWFWHLVDIQARAIVEGVPLNNVFRRYRLATFELVEENVRRIPVKPTTVKRRFYEERQRLLKQAGISREAFRASGGSYGAAIDQIIGDHVTQMRG